MKTYDVSERMAFYSRLLKQLTSAARFYRFDHDESERWWERAYSVHETLDWYMYVASYDGDS